MKVPTTDRGVRSVKFDKKLWWQVKSRASELEQSVSEYLEGLVNEDLKKRKK